MTSADGATHLAVVPVARLDDSTRRALQYAATLTPQVIAVHVETTGDPWVRPFAANWGEYAPEVPLCVVQAGGTDWRAAFQRALDTLTAEARGNAVTVVYPDY